MSELSLAAVPLGQRRTTLVSFPLIGGFRCCRFLQESTPLTNIAPFAVLPWTGQAPNLGLLLQPMWMGICAARDAKERPPKSQHSL